MKGKELLAQNVVDELKKEGYDYKKIVESRLNNILDDKNLTDSQKVSKINKIFDIKISLNELQNKSNIIQEISEDTSLEKIISEDINNIANKMRWESKFFRDFNANNQKLTNMKLVVDEDDFVHYVDKNGTLFNPDEVRGKVAFIDEKFMNKDKESKAEIYKNEKGEYEIIEKYKEDIITDKIKVWETENYENGNKLMKGVIDNEYTIKVRPNTSNTGSPGSIIPLSRDREAYLKSDGSPGKGSDSIMYMNFDRTVDYIVDDGIKNNLTKIKNRKETLNSFMIYGHEMNHGYHNQKGINDQRFAYYFYLDSKGNKHVTGEEKEYIELKHKNGNIKTEAEIFDESLNLIKMNEYMEGQKRKLSPNENPYTQMLKELNNENSEIFRHFKEEIRIKTEMAKKNNSRSVNLNIPKVLIKQEEFNTVGNPEMAKDFKEKYPDLPTEQGMENERGIPKRAVYKGEIE
ncbi:hypothetical protein [Leptotrichia trevisanii]|uniref:hypothetical protein n=1 Tax=Leptotrichia trevisanii TaxID=109328 RepID=UPI0026F2D9C8|nr:hypothetical protein [Leptotrichia trevisanii]